MKTKKFLGFHIYDPEVIEFIDNLKIYKIKDYQEKISSQREAFESTIKYLLDNDILVKRETSN